MSVFDISIDVVGKRSGADEHHIWQLSFGGVAFVSLIPYSSLNNFCIYILIFLVNKIMMFKHRIKLLTSFPKIVIIFSLMYNLFDSLP